MHNEAFTRRTCRRGRRTLATIVVVGALGATSVPAQATIPQSDTIVYTLPGEEVFAEGIAVDGDTYYVTGVGSSTIYRGDLDEPMAEALAADVNWGPMGGIKVVGEYLIVARGPSGTVSLHDRQSGAVVARWTNHVWPDPTNINDIAIAPNGDAYITDSELPLLYRIPAAELDNPSAGVHDLAVFLEWADPPFSNYVSGYLDANGIVATPDGRFVLVVHYSDGLLFRVRLSDQQVRQVDLRGSSLFSGDGMVIANDNVLYVVRPGRSLVATLRLDAQYRRARLVSETSDPSFHCPTTAAIAGDRLLVVNSQFCGPSSAPPWTVSNIPLP